MKATTVREELVVALFGDAADLIKRLEALTPVMNDTRLGLAKATRELAAQLEPFQAHMQRIATREQYKAVHYVREQVEQTSHFWQQRQVALLKEAGLAILKEDVRSSLDHLLLSLKETSAHLKRRETVLMHVTNTVVSVAATAVLVALLVPRPSAETAASSRPVPTVESPCPAPAAAPPERARVRK